MLPAINFREDKFVEVSSRDSRFFSEKDFRYSLFLFFRVDIFIFSGYSVKIREIYDKVQYTLVYAQGTETNRIT